MKRAFCLIFFLMGIALSQTDITTTIFGEPQNKGAYHVYTCAIPAAGAEFTCTVPTGKIWKLISLNAQLVTSSAVANRVVSILADDGTRVFTRSTANVNQAASLTANYGVMHCSGLAAGSTGSGNALYSPWACDTLLGPAYRIRSSTALIDTADAWGQPVVLVEEWSK